MKRSWITRTIFILSLLFSFNACDLQNENGQVPVTENKYLISYRLDNSYPKAVIDLLFSQLGSTVPEVTAIRSKINYSINVYKVTYKTTFQKQDKVASGLVCIPIGSGPFPLLSFQNGTNTLNANAPSVNPGYELYQLIEAVASTGFVVIIPDYLGFGSSSQMFHPYLHKESTVESVTDLLRAVKEMFSNHLKDIKISKDLYLMGYSQGGWATLALQKEIETKHAQDFTLKASACGAGPYNLTEMTSYVLLQQQYPMPAFLGYMMNSFIKAGETSLSYGAIFNRPYDTRVPVLYDGTKSIDEINAQLTANVNELFTIDLRNNFSSAASYASLRTALQKNSVEAWATTTPTLLLHGNKDLYVPFMISTYTYQKFLDAGAANRVTFVPLPELDHNGAIVPSGLASIKWFLDLKQ